MTTGGCLCGAVRYEAEGEPYHVVHCHCIDCRKSTGAPFVTWASFERKNFRFATGLATEIRWEGRIRGFCSKCGTGLFFLKEPTANEIDVTVGSFDRQEKIIPADHVWVEDRLPWIELVDNLPRHTRTRNE